MSRRTIANATVALYLLGAAFVLVTFLRAPPDGLANVWIAVYVLPVTALTLLIGRGGGAEFPIAHLWFGYYGGHAAYFVPAVLLCALLIRRLAGGRWW